MMALRMAPPLRDLPQDAHFGPWRPKAEPLSAQGIPVRGLWLFRDRFDTLWSTLFGCSVRVVRLHELTPMKYVIEERMT